MLRRVLAPLKTTFFSGALGDARVVVLVLLLSTFFFSSLLPGGGSCVVRRYPW